MSVTRRDFLKLGAAIVAVSMPAGAPHVAAAKTRRKNVLLIIDEDIQDEILGIYNGGITHTPDIDRFAGQSVRFDNAYCAMPEHAQLVKKMRKLIADVYYRSPVPPLSKRKKHK